MENDRRLREEQAEIDEAFLRIVQTNKLVTPDDYERNLEEATNLLPLISSPSLIEADSGNSAVTLCILSGRYALATLLLQNGAYGGTASYDYYATAMHALCTREYPKISVKLLRDMVDLLLKNGAYINAKDFHECTPLYYAAGYHSFSVDHLRCLIERGADPRAEVNGEKIYNSALDDAKKQFLLAAYEEADSRDEGAVLEGVMAEPKAEATKKIF